MLLITKWIDSKRETVSYKNLCEDSIRINQPKMLSTLQYQRWIRIYLTDGLRLIRKVVVWQVEKLCLDQTLWQIQWEIQLLLLQEEIICLTHQVEDLRIDCKINLQTSNKIQIIRVWVKMDLKLELLVKKWALRS